MVTPRQILTPTEVFVRRSNPSRLQVQRCAVEESRAEDGDVVDRAEQRNGLVVVVQRVDILTSSPQHQRALLQQDTAVLRSHQQVRRVEQLEAVAGVSQLGLRV